MKYYIYNKLSRCKIKNTNEQMREISTLDQSFYNSLTREDEVILYGGDGTINGFVNKCSVLPKISIIKGGTGNDLARSLSPNFEDVSIFQVNGKKYLNGFDVGFGAKVCQLVESDKSKNKLSYLKNVYLGMKQSQYINAKITIDDTSYTENRCFLITAQNNKYFGGGMVITPNANITDKEVHVCVIQNAPKLLITLIFPTVFIGKHMLIKKYVKIYKGTNVEIELDTPYIGECDGEVISAVNNYKINFHSTVKIRVLD